MERHEQAAVLSKTMQCITVFKGAKTMIAAPDGRIMVNQCGSYALAKGGSGDVLSGIIGALADKGQPDKYLIAMKYLETMKSITAGQNNKVVYMPYEATGILSSVDGIKQMFDKQQT